MPPVKRSPRRTMVPVERLHWVDQHYRTLPPLSREEESWLIPLAQAGDEVAADRLIRANVRFAAQVAMHYARKYHANATDLVPVAVSGLWYAVQRFDTTRQHKFISYAVWWVKARLEEELPQMGNIVRRPQHARVVDVEIGRTRERLEQQTGGVVDESVVLEEVEPFPGYVPQLTVWSLDDEIDNRHTWPTGSRPADKTRHELVPGEDGEAVAFGALAADQLRAQVQGLLDNEGCYWFSTNRIGDREREILTLYFGIGTHAPATLEQIGQLMGLTRERVRQIKEAALSKLKLRINGNRAEMMELVEG